jgi:hypothetical protein
VLSGSFITKKDNKEILKKAIDFFVNDVGLQIIEKGDYCINFADDKGVGFVTLRLCKQNKGYEVRLESKEYEHFIQDFADKI